MPRSATSTVWSLTPSAGGCSRPSATCKFSAVRWAHSWCRVRSLGLRTSRPSTRYTASAPGRVDGQRSEVEHCSPVVLDVERGRPCHLHRRPRGSRAGAPTAGGVGLVRPTARTDHGYVVELRNTSMTADGLTDDVLTQQPRSRTLRAYLRDAVDRLAGADPGLTQLRTGLQSVLGIA